MNNDKDGNIKRKGLSLQISRAEFCKIKTESGEEIEIHFYKASENKCVIRISAENKKTIIFRENYAKQE